MQVKKINNSEWWNFVKDCPSATFFHTPDWYQVWEDYKGNNYEARLFSFKSGRQALLPLSSTKRLKGLLKAYSSGPAGTYGGIISKDQLSKQEIKQLKKYLRGFSAMQIRIYPLAPIFENSYFSREDFTQMIDLSKGWKFIFENWSKNHKRSVKKGIKEGVQIKIADKYDWKIYYDIYQDSRKRWGEKASNNYSWKLFKILSQLNPNICKLWLAFKDDTIVSGCLCFYYNEHVVYWHGASLEIYFHLRPVHVLQYNIIKDAIELGYSWYDFNPSGGHEGVVKFKAGFGALSIPTDTLSKKPILFEVNNFFRKK